METEKKTSATNKKIRLFVPKNRLLDTIYSGKYMSELQSLISEIYLFGVINNRRFDEAAKTKIQSKMLRRLKQRKKRR